MNKNHYFYVLAFTCLVIGISFFLIQREFLVIQWSFANKHSIANTSTTTKREITIYCWNGQQYIDHQTSLIWNRANHLANLRVLVDAWLRLTYTEQILSQRVSLQSISWPKLDKEAYLSFDSKLLDHEWSIRTKIFFIQSLFKTISQAQIPLNHIIFLVHYQSMLDEHLDFSYPWPIDGFVQSQE